MLALLGGCASDAPSGDAAPAGPDPLLRLTEEGVAGLDGTTSFSPEAVRAALPEGFAIETGRVETTRDTIPVFYAFSDGQIILEVYPDGQRQRVGRIDASSELVMGPNATQAGAGFGAMNGADMSCEPGTDELTGRAVCSPRGGGPFRYVFAHGADTARGELPDRDVLAQSILERIVWMAP